MGGNTKKPSFSELKLASPYSTIRLLGGKYDK